MSSSPSPSPSSSYSFFSDFNNNSILNYTTNDGDNNNNYDDNDENDPIPGYIWAAFAIILLMIIICLIGSLIATIQSLRKRLQNNNNNPHNNPYFDESTMISINSIYSNNSPLRINDDEFTSSASSTIQSPSSLHRYSSNHHLMIDGIIPISEIRNWKQIEKGSFGIIYEATWRGTRIAVKKLPTTLNEKALKEFYQEAALMRSLRHPNILQYLGIAHYDKEISICMEFMDRGSLYRLLHQRNSEFTRSKIKSIAFDAAKGMNYLHQRFPPIIHRDLKSHNLLVRFFFFSLFIINQYFYTSIFSQTHYW